MNLRQTFVVWTALILSACASESLPVPNSNGLSPEAQSLSYILDQGCLPYVLGQKSEKEAMEGIGLRKQANFNPLVSLPPQWTGRYTGVAAVTVEKFACYFHVSGRHQAEYLKITTTVLHERLGADADQDARSTVYTKYVPGEIKGCSRGVQYTYYPSPPPSSPGWDVSVRRDCDAH